MSESQTIRFRSKSPDLFSGLTGVVDEQNFTIRGVSCITSDCEAEGHSLFVDNTTLTQLHDLSKSMEQVPVTINHEGKVEDVNGWLQNFRVDGNKLRADWVLLETHKETPTMLERARKQPKTFGLSFSFKGDPKGTTVNGRQCARAEAVMSCDVVKRAAANKGGLFSAKDAETLSLAPLHSLLIELAKPKSVDSLNFSKLTNMDPLNQTSAEPTLAQIMEAVTALGGRIDGFERTQGAIVDHINGGGEQQQEQQGPLSEQEIAEIQQMMGMSDEQLAAIGVERDALDNFVANYNAAIAAQEGGEGADGGEGEGAEGYQGQVGGGEGDMAGAGAGAGAGGATAFSALQREVIQLKAIITAEQKAKKQNAEAIQFQAIEGNMVNLATQRDQAIALAEKLVTENELLQLHVKTGTRPVRAGVDADVRLFSASEDGQLHPFQARIKVLQTEKKCTEGEAIKFAVKENPALHADWLDKQTIRA